MNDCVHHWVIEEPNGEYSLGRCHKCGKEKLFRNKLGDDWILNSEARIEWDLVGGRLY